MILRLVRWELFKLARQRASYVGFVVCLGFVLVSLVGFRMSRWKNLRRYSDLGYDPLELINGPFFASYSLQIAFFAILPLLAATLAGNQLAGEARDGTLRAMLVRPPSRISVYLAKTIATWLWLQLIVVFLVALSLLVGSVALGGGDLLVFVWEFRKDGPWIVDSPDWGLLLAAISVGAGASLFVVAACALMLSAWTDAPVVAHVGTLGAFFTSVILERLPAQLVGEELRELTPTAHMTYWHELFRIWDVVDSFDSARFWGDLAWCTVFVVIFLAAGAWRFVRKDVTS